jgi:hypothetical protein
MYKKALEILAAISSLSLAIKTWRREVSDLFQEARFFQSRDALSLHEFWQTIIHAMFHGDMSDLLSRITAIPSSSIFGSKESEVLVRSYAVKRLTFVIFSAPVDYYLQQLPLIQEKIVEILKGPSGLMHVEAYLCLRVLLTRISTKHLSNFWPIVLTELIRLFSQFLKGEQEIDVFYGACKFLDLLLVLNIEEFQWYFNYAS